MTLFLLLLAVLATFSAGAVFGYRMGCRVKPARPTPMMRDLAAIMRTNRMHAMQDRYLERQ